MSLDPPSLPGRQVTESELRFFGAISASIAHEVNNVLAMVNELAGLLGDSLQLARTKGRALDPDKLESLSQRIVSQVERGKGIVSKLSSFAHCVDDPDASLDLAENIELIGAHCRRFAKLRRSELIAHQGVGAILLRGSSFALQHVLYRGIEACLLTADGDHPVRLEFEASDDGARVRFTGGRGREGAQELPGMLAALAELAAELGGSARAEDREGQELVLILDLPRVLQLPGRAQLDGEGTTIR